MNCTLLLTLQAQVFDSGFLIPLPELPRDQSAAVTFAVFSVALWFCPCSFYFVLYCPLFRVEPICFVTFFRTIKIHHHQPSLSILFF
jgi:hypothetical protein